MTDTNMPLIELLQKHDEGDFLRAVTEAVLQTLMEHDVEGLMPPGALSQGPCFPRLNKAQSAPRRLRSVRLPILSRRKTALFSRGKHSKRGGPWMSYSYSCASLFAYLGCLCSIRARDLRINIWITGVLTEHGDTPPHGVRKRDHLEWSKRDVATDVMIGRVPYGRCRTDARDGRWATPGNTWTVSVSHISLVPEATGCGGFGPPGMERRELRCRACPLPCIGRRRRVVPGAFRPPAAQPRSR